MLRPTFARGMAACAVGLLAGGCSLLVDMDGLGGGAPRGDGGGTGRTDAGGEAFIDGGPKDGSTDAGDAAIPPGPCVPSGLVMQTTLKPSAAVDDARVGSVAWIGASNALALDGALAHTASMSGSVSSHWLRTSGYGATLPARSIVRGFVVQVTRKASFKDEIGDQSIAMVKAGVPGTGKVAQGSWGTTLDTITYGSPTELWGTTWTPADVNATDLGVAIAARGLPAADETASVDAVTLTVHYEPCAP
ncbi:MAG: hypothetical protein HOO96_17995 [Polyangiaceae bacterium]|nr:hypothetical protein [Polyangiaceae bacterium]